MDDKTLSELTLEECQRLLSSYSFGRLAFLDRVGEFPMIIPVNYRFVDNSVVIRSGEGSKFRAAVENAGAAFEIDDVDEQRRVGWSVVVRGRMEAVDDRGDIERLQEAEPVAWAPGDRPHYLRLNASLVSGRRISITDGPSNWWG